MIYSADGDTDGVDELYLGDTAAPGVATRLNPALVAGGNVTDFVVNASNTRLLYRADQDTDEVFELYLVDLDSPGVSTRINGLLVGGGDVMAEFMFSPDGTQVVYRADEDVNGVFELFLVNIATPGFAANLSGPQVSGGDVSSGLVLSPDGALLAYHADQLLNGVYELFVVELDNPGVTTRINRNPASGGDVLTNGYLFSPASDAVAYVADEDVNNLTEFYLVELASPAVSIKLNSPLVAAGDLTRGIAFSGDGNDLFYVADQDTDAVTELYRVSRSTPGATVRINSALVAGGNVLPTGFVLTSDGDQLVYQADQDADEDFELYIVELDSPAVSTRLNAALPVDGDVLEFVLIP